MQGISRVFNHVRGRCVLGYKLLLRTSFDSKTTLPFVFFHHSSPIWQFTAKWKVLHPNGVSTSHQWCLPTAQYVLSNTTSILKFLYANLYQDEKEWILISNFRIVKSSFLNTIICTSLKLIGISILIECTLMRPTSVFREQSISLKIILLSLLSSKIII